MYGNDNRTQNGGGLLKTTTWGALIALSLLVTAWGFNARWTGSKPVSTTVAQNVTQPSLTASKATQATPSANGTSLVPSKQSSALGSLFDSDKSHEQNAPVTVAAAQREAVAAESLSGVPSSTDPNR